MVELFSEDVLKLLLAAAFGSVLGLEREWSGKSAGFRTIMLVAIGSCLFAIISYRMADMAFGEDNDATRIASNIVTGIGFIGAGLIFKGNDQGVHGLTTAATVWAAAAIGMALAIGEYILAGVVTALVWAILVVFYYIQLWIDKVLDTRKYKISYDSEDGILDYNDFFDNTHFTLKAYKQQKLNSKIVTEWTVKAPRKYHEQAIERMLLDNRITELEY